MIININTLGTESSDYKKSVKDLKDEGYCSSVMLCSDFDLKEKYGECFWRDFQSRFKKRFESDKSLHGVRLNIAGVKKYWFKRDDLIRVLDDVKGIKKEKKKKIFLTKDEADDLRFILDAKLREYEEFDTIYLERLNSIFRKLTGRNHDVWGRTFYYNTKK